MYNKLTTYDVVTILYCSECDENKDYDEIETNDSRITTQYGSYTKTTGNCILHCNKCGNEIEIINEI